jgi:homotetrameric cytidine deaminase
MVNLTSETVAQLSSAARSAAEKAYSPYSRFRVGAALLFDDGKISTGCNVENVSYGLSICAERTALVRAIAEDGASRKIVAVLVTNLNDAASSPCGACLQMLSEFMAKGAVVFFATDSGMTSKPFAELLPFGFTNWKMDSDAHD